MVGSWTPKCAATAPPSSFRRSWTGLGCSATDSHQLRQSEKHDLNRKQPSEQTQQLEDELATTERRVQRATSQLPTHCSSRFRRQHIRRATEEQEVLGHSTQFCASGMHTARKILSLTASPNSHQNGANFVAHFCLVQCLIRQHAISALASTVKAPTQFAAKRGGVILEAGVAREMKKQRAVGGTPEKHMSR